MRIANYLRPDCVALRQRADSLTGAVQQMVTLLNGTDNLTDTAVFAADVRARLALGGVCVGNGLAIPHAKSTAVRQLQLAALTLDPPLPCDTPDGKPLDLLVMIAAPAEANDLHVQVLAELATLFLDTDFCARLRESETPEAFCRAISAREEQDAQEPPSAPSDAAPGAAKPGYQLLAVTACPTGIAHTYLAAEALQQAAQARGLTLKVETNGAAGVNDELTDDEIQAAECVIVAVDRSIPLARFVGKRLVYASAGDAVRDADRLLEKAVSGKAPVYRGGHAFRTSDWKELGRDSIADRPGFMPGLMGGYLAQLGTTTAPRLGWISSGFWGAIVAGFAAGLAVRLLNYLFRRIPQELDHIKTGLLVPLLSLLFVGALMVMAINPPLGRFNAWLSIQLDGMQGGSRLVLGTLLGGMMATDYGGPINKAAYVSGTLALVDQQYDLMAAVMAGGMIPPLGIGLACLLFPTRFTSTERCSAPQTLLMGATFVTEGALPFALRDPLRVSLACIAGSALAGFITILLGCGCPAPHGGLFLLPVMENPPGFLIALAVGTLTTALLLGILKKPLKH